MANKDEEFARIVSTHRNALLRYGLRRLDDHSTAADTFVVVWRHFNDLPQRDEELFWLYGIAGRVLSNLLRSRQRSLLLEGRLALERELGLDTPRYSKEDIEELMQALGALSPEQQELIQLAYWEKLSYREIGLVIGCSEKAGGIRLSRTRKALRNLLNEASAEVTPIPLLKKEI
jgi:RNA polymerase sigma factor (sigma-70 family)